MLARAPMSKVLLVGAMLVLGCGGRGGSGLFVPQDTGMDDDAGAGVDVRGGADARAPDGGSDAGVPPRDAGPGPDTDEEDVPPLPSDLGDRDVGPPSDGGAGSCPEASLGSMVGPRVAMGSTAGAMNDLEGTCGGGGAGERTFAWRAPAAGTYTIDTVGSGYDTVLYVRDGSCTGMELDCNDDTHELDSEVEVTVRAGQMVVIVVDGFASSRGAFVLNIRAGGASSGDGGGGGGGGGTVEAGL